MSLAMTQEEREAFLADLHVGVISIEQEGRPPLTVPIWYDYTPHAGAWVITADNSLKARHLLAAGRFTLVAQSEEPPAGGRTKPPTESELSHPRRRTGNG